MKVLLTGFDPFGGEAVNPALEVVRQLDGAVIANAAVVTREILVYVHAANLQVAAPRNCLKLNKAKTTLIFWARR